MIVGSGLLAAAFVPRAAELRDICVYATGVSNSSCTDAREFVRDRERLQHTLACVDATVRFVYFSTCSVDDPWSRNGPYTTHKSRLEELVRTRGNCLIARLPQVAGNSPNPHTLLNYLYNRIVRSERFDLWHNSSRNVIDVADVAKIVLDLASGERWNAATVNIANFRNSEVLEIVSAFETITRRRAIFDRLDKGGSYSIDTTRIADSVQRCGISFDESYLLRTLRKYYG